LAWINVIINEELYDKDFVANYTYGFEQLKNHIQTYNPEYVSKITWIPVEQIVESARIYATNGPAVMPWGPIHDQQANSTQSIRALMILRAICGHLDVEGGELLMGFHPEIISESEVDMMHAMPVEQRSKQLGADRFKLPAWDTLELLADPHERVWGIRYPNNLQGATLAHPGSIWSAMSTGKPYPVRAMIVHGANVIQTYANTKRIFEGLMSLELSVVHELFMSPTAQLADYVLPGATWLEKSALRSYWDWINVYLAGEKCIEPAGEARDDYQFWRGLALEMGQAEHWPWETIDEYHDWRLSKTGMNFKEFIAAGGVSAPPREYKKYVRTGFATPTGKVELYSTVLDKLGYEPMPVYVEPPESPVSTPEVYEQYPWIYFVGDKGDAFFQTTGRQLESLRRLTPNPQIELHVDAAKELGICHGDRVCVETRTGKMYGFAKVTEDQHPRVIRVPTGWWYPEREQGLKGKLSGLFESHDGLLTNDTDEFCDPAQGLPHFRGLLCKIYKTNNSRDGQVEFDDAPLRKVMGAK
jgi:anaerobic selenocysteine-containing dehydrogenase